jgi:molybdate transport system permease protein
VRPPERRAAPRLPLGFGLLAGIGAAFVGLPLAALLLRAPWHAAWTELASPEVATALRLSLLCSLVATLLSIALGLPLAWVQARSRWPGRSLLRGLVLVPVVLPPVVGGVALLMAFGRRGTIGSWLAATLGIQLPFTTAGAVLAETFVALPFFVLTVEGGLRALDPRLEEAARTLGAGPWTVLCRVTLPLLRPTLMAGAALAWARALGEFGATITFAGSFPGRTQTVPLLVYLALGARPEAGVLLSVLLLAVSLVVLIALRRRFLEAL